MSDLAGSSTRIIKVISHTTRLSKTFQVNYGCCSESLSLPVHFHWTAIDPSGMITGRAKV